MRKVLLVLAMVALTFSINAQETYGTYKVATGEISASVTLDEGEVYLDLSKDGKYGLILTDKDRLNLTVFLNNSRVKFLEWSDKATEASVKDLSKDIMKSNTFDGFFRYGSWKYGRTVLTTIFFIEEDGTQKFYIYGPIMTSSSNKYIKSKSTAINLTSEEDFKSLLNIISDTTINDFIQKKSKDKELFN